MNIEVPMESQVCGFYKLVKRKASTMEVVESLEFPNLITNVGLDMIGNMISSDTCYVGTGNAPPQPTDVRLQSVRAWTQATVAGSKTLDPTNTTYWAQHTITWRFPSGSASGNISEVAIGDGLHVNFLAFSRALVLDPAGNPTSITILADEILDVTYSYRAYPPLTDTTFTVEISGVTHTCVCRAAGVTGDEWRAISILNTDVNYMYSTAYSVGALGPITGWPTGAGSTESRGGSPNYVNGTFYRYYDNTFGLGMANIPGGIGAFATRMEYSQNRQPGAFQLSIDPPIQKTSDKVLTLRFKRSWKNYAP